MDHANFVLDGVNYPTAPDVGLFNEIAELLTDIFAEGSNPTVGVGGNGPTLTLTTYGFERVVFSGVLNALLVRTFSPDDQGAPYCRKGPSALSCEFVHEPVSAALMICVAFLTALEEARDDENLQLRLRANIEGEVEAARVSTSELFNWLVQQVDDGEVTPLLRRGRWAVEALRKEYPWGHPSNV